MSDAFAPPNDYEIELSLFGYGYGESILIHIGDKRWVIIDSCINPLTNRSLPLEYLENIGVNPRKNVKQIILTHWHDDHCRGISEIVEICEEADFYCSAALQCEEFFNVLSAYSTNKSLEYENGVREINKVFNVLQNRKANISKIPRLIK